MDANELLDLYTSVVAVGTEKALVNRLDTGITGVKSTATATRRVVGIIGRCANTGYIVGRIDQTPVITVDMSSLNAQTVPIPLDIAVPVGSELKFKAQSSSGTAAVYMTALVAVGA